jgi:hypothetical protein
MDWAERRNSERKRTLLQGRVVFNNRFSTIECTVKDLSGTGAQIVFEHPTEIPRQVELEIPSRGLAVRCEVRWSRDKRHGLMFVPQPSAAPPPRPPAPAPPELPAPARAVREDPSALPGPASEGWIIRVVGPGEPPQVRLFAVAEPDAREALACLLRSVGASQGERFEPAGRISADAVARLQVPPGAALDLSGS